MDNTNWMVMNMGPWRTSWSHTWRIHTHTHAHTRTHTHNRVDGFHGQHKLVMVINMGPVENMKVAYLASIRTMHFKHTCVAAYLNYFFFLPTFQQTFFTFC